MIRSSVLSWFVDWINTIKHVFGYLNKTQPHLMLQLISTPLDGLALNSRSILRKKLERSFCFSWLFQPCLDKEWNMVGVSWPGRASDPPGLHSSCFGLKWTWLWSCLVHLAVTWPVAGRVWLMTWASRVCVRHVPARIVCSFSLSVSL